ncbi:DoxX family protein [Brevibacillus sp. SYSU BS000544]|uniref:DoxX family protein n=1 Tax=Brevibacillus sp. SYSU BS000544 TaxID=3416443 RepID=UPI003CE49A87
MKGRVTDFANAILRISVGFIFAAHGVFKYSWGMGNLADWLAQQGFPLPGVTAPVLTGVELLGGLLLMLGVGTRYISAIFSCILLVALFKVKLSVGFIATNATGYEFDFILLVVSLFISLTGESTLDKAMKKRFGQEKVG